MPLLNRQPIWPINFIFHVQSSLFLSVSIGSIPSSLRIRMKFAFALQSYTCKQNIPLECISIIMIYQIILFKCAGLPDSFAKVSVDGTGQVYTTEPYKGSLDPKWNTHYDLYLGRGDGITITVYNQKKIHKKQGFLGCVRIGATTIQRLKDTGCT